MTDDLRRERLRRLTGQRADELREREAQAPGPSGRALDPGDLFVHPATAELPVEWLLLSRDGADPRRALLVPADTHSLAGAGDLWLPEEETGGPLALRCAHPVRVGPEILAGAEPTGRIGRGALERARRLTADLENGLHRPSPEEEDAAADPEHRAWVADVLLPARRRMEERAAEAASRSSGALPRPLLALAAALVVAAVGLGAWMAGRAGGGAPEPMVFGQTAEVVLGGDVRGGSPIRLRPDGASTLLFVVLERREPGERYRVELVPEGAEGRWTSPPIVPGDLSELYVAVPSRFLVAGSTVRLIVHVEEADGLRPIEERSLLVTEPEPPR